MFIGCAYSLLGSGTSEATVIEQKNNCASEEKGQLGIFTERLQFGYLMCVLCGKFTVDNCMVFVYNKG